VLRFLALLKGEALEAQLALAWTSTLGVLACG